MVIQNVKRGLGLAFGSWAAAGLEDRFLDQKDPLGLSKGLVLSMPVAACPVHQLEPKVILKYVVEPFLSSLYLVPIWTTMS